MYQHFWFYSIPDDGCHGFKRNGSTMKWRGKRKNNLVRKRPKGKEKSKNADLSGEERHLAFVFPFVNASGLSALESPTSRLPSVMNSKW
jgi:hypothetical protein